MIIRRLILSLGLCVLTFGLFACKSKSDTDPNTGGGAKTTQIDQENVDFRSEGGTRNITVKTNFSGWKAKSNQDWCRATSMGQSLKLEIDPNTDGETREATVTLTFGNERKEIHIRQLGKDSEILVDKQIFDIPASGGTIAFKVTSNYPVKLELPEWIQTDQTTVETPRALIEDVYRYAVQAHAEGEGRSFSIKITEQNVPTGKTPKVATVEVRQQGLNSYRPVNSDAIKEDIKLRVVSGNATSYQNGEDISKSYDGDYTTIYHSNYNNSSSEYFPITLTYKLDKEQDVDYIVYHPRQSAQNGIFKDVEISYSKDSINWTTWQRKTLEMTNSATKFEFDTPIQARYFRFTVYAGYGDRQGFASCSEMEFYQRNPDTFRTGTLFSDPSCTVLKAGITEADIQKCPDPFFRELAFRISKNSYPTEFRVDEFKAWLDPLVMASRNKTNAFSRLDNPTGIAVDKNDNLIVLVGDTHGFQRLSILIQNLDREADKADGFGGIMLPLTEGVNKFKAPDKGLIYVMYQAKSEEELARLKPIKIHFATGTVNGYFDTQKESHRGRWKELLGKATNKHFDLVGKYAHMTFPTDKFRANTPDGLRLANAFDTIVNSEFKLHGYYKYNCMPKNRMYLHVMYTAFMYATYYHTAYNASTMDGLTNPDLLTTSHCWGPSHEIGHMHQTRPGLLWRGMTEVTVNIPSEFVQTYVFGQPSRIQSEELKDKDHYAGINNRYTMAYNAVMVPKEAFSQAHDVFRNLVPFWQLELYFGKVLGRTPAYRKDFGGFYPDVYEYLRKNPDQKGAGNQQTEFPYVASKVAQVDLTEFFQDWGFFKPIDASILDYSTEQLQVTDARSTEVKNRIKALGYDKPTLKIQYITDNNSELYKHPAEIVAGQSAEYTAPNQSITIRGWRNVAVYEVYDASGKLIYMADGSFPSLDEARFSFSGFVQGCTIKAVSVYGTKVNVPVSSK